MLEACLESWACFLGSLEEDYSINPKLCQLEQRSTAYTTERPKVAFFHQGMLFAACVVGHMVVRIVATPVWKSLANRDLRRDFIQVLKK